MWGGFILTLAAAFSYIPVFARFAVTRDFPWANLLMFAAALAMVGVGVYRAYARPAEYRGKVSGAILATLSLAIFGLFCVGSYMAARSLPPPPTALRVGQQAPDFTLTDSAGQAVNLSALRQGHRAVLLIFYRGYW
jgi:hypothetical protein